jgi:predicted nucleic-acid-binding Zn-ribbon protein
MKDGKCPMCGSSEVYENHATEFLASNNNVRLKDDHGNIVPSTTFIPYICVNCGFTAMYAKDMEALKELPKAEGWKKATR